MATDAVCVLNYFTNPPAAAAPQDNVYYGYGTNIIPIIGVRDKTGLTKVYGALKVDERPTGGTTQDYAFQIRSISAKTSGSHWGIDSETHVAANGTASVRGVQGCAVLDATFTATGATYVGTYGQARADGTFTGSGFLAGLYGVIEASAAITASHVCSAWLDSHQANTVTGSHELLYATNNGAAQMDQFCYLYGGGKITNFVAFDTCTGMVSDTATTAGASKKIQILVDGTPYYINAYAGA